MRFLNTLCERHKAETELYSDHALANQADHIHCCQLKDTEKMKYVPETGSILIISFFCVFHETVRNKKQIFIFALTSAFLIVCVPLGGIVLTLTLP